MKIKIISWNIWCYSYFDEVAKFLERCDADIIGIQELLLDDKSRDVVTILEKLGYDYVSALGGEFTKGEKLIKLNNAVFSRLPIVEKKIHKIIEGKMGSVAEARIKVGDQEICIFSTHLKHTHLEPSDYQLEQVEGLISLVQKRKSVVMGDFNAVPESLPIKRMREVFSVTDEEFQPTWCQYPEGCDVCKLQKIDTRLDYIFVTKDIKFSDSKVESPKGSDHLPVSVTIEV